MIPPPLAPAPRSPHLTVPNRTSLYSSHPPAAFCRPCTSSSQSVAVLAVAGAAHAAPSTTHKTIRNLLQPAFSQAARAPASATGSTYRKRPLCFDGAP
jgi:hypothetical protein